MCISFPVALESPQAENTGPSPHLKGRYGILLGKLQIKQKQGLVQGAGVRRPEGESVSSSQIIPEEPGLWPRTHLDKNLGELKQRKAG